MDSKTETVSDNELIADWMASKINVNERGRKEYLLLNAPKGFSGDCWYELGNIRYATSWDWLMPVVEKISKTKPMNQAWFDVKYHLLNADIKVVYRRVVEFIRWHNSQSPDTIK